MKMLDAYIHTPLAQTTGMSLLQFLWEGALIALVLAAALWTCGPRRARLRYAFSCLAMLAMPLAFGITLAVTRPGAFPRFPTAQAVPRAAEPGLSLFANGSGAGRLLDLMPWAVPFWMAGVLIFYARGLGGWMAARQLRGAGVCAAPAAWQDRLDAMRVRLRVAKPVLLLESCMVDVPVVVGFLRPAILTPVGVLMGLPAEQVELILLHELAHIRRHDYPISVLQAFVEGLLFYHPAVWWVGRQVRAERENCCDDVVVNLEGDARGYAAALATLENNRWPARQPALAADGGNLMKRIHRLLEKPPETRSAAAPVFATGVVMAALAVTMGAWQTRQTPDGRNPYEAWVKEDVAYIITDAERAAYTNLQSDPEREHFIEQFWLRRDPTPGTPANEFKKEHYRRIAYANDHFSVGHLPGWKTDRGRIYITYGPPDEIEAHPAGGAGAAANQMWGYRFIEGIGDNIIIEFRDTAGNGEYRMTTDPAVTDDRRFSAGSTRATVQVMNSSVALISIPLSGFGNHQVRVLGSIHTGDRQVSDFDNTIQGPAPLYTRMIAVRVSPGSYKLRVVVRDVTAGTQSAEEIPFDVR
jgi:GWxTD domain-containing protein